MPSSPCRSSSPSTRSPDCTNSASRSSASADRSRACARSPSTTSPSRASPPSTSSASGTPRIAHIGGDREFDLDFHLPTNRRIGYEGALRDAGIELDQRLFAPADFTIRGGYHAAKQLLGVPHDRPTAIFAASDEMAIGSILAARDLGLVVPRDVSIVGIDDHDLSDFFGLSTVAQFPRLQGEMAVEILLEQLEPETDAATHAAATPLPYELRVRSSTARPTER